jgi:pimeloyl-ACP methyl ester carboxylesterase
MFMPDMRAYGSSARPHKLESYPTDVLAADVEDFVAHLGIVDYGLAGYSLGGRTVARLLARGARPRRAVIAGTRIEGILHAAVGARDIGASFPASVPFRPNHRNGIPNVT